MARRRRNPNWPEETQECLDREQKAFERNLKAIATSCAKQEKAINVDPRHVDEAFSTLSSLGLRRRVWYKRPEFEVGIGSFLIGIALSSPDILPVFFPEEWLKAQAITRSVIVTCFVIGTILTLRGWFRGKL